MSSPKTGTYKLFFISVEGLLVGGRILPHGAPFPVGGLLFPSFLHIVE